MFPLHGMKWNIVIFTSRIYDVLRFPVPGLKADFHEEVCVRTTVNGGTPKSEAMITFQQGDTWSGWGQPWSEKWTCISVHHNIFVKQCFPLVDQRVLYCLYFRTFLHGGRGLPQLHNLVRDICPWHPLSDNQWFIPLIGRYYRAGTGFLRRDIGVQSPSITWYLRQLHLNMR